MSKNQQKILLYIQSIMNLTNMKLIDTYDANSIILIDGLLIFHFIYINNKILLIKN